MRALGVSAWLVALVAEVRGAACDFRAEISQVGPVASCQTDGKVRARDTARTRGQDRGDRGCLAHLTRLGSGL